MFDLSDYLVSGKMNCSKLAFGDFEMKILTFKKFNKQSPITTRKSRKTIAQWTQPP